MGKISKSSGLIQIIRKKNRNESAEPLESYGSVRASSYHSLCAREEVLRSLHKVVRPTVVNADQLLTFNHGTGLHYAIQNEVLPDLGILYGSWLCLNCGVVYGAQNGRESVLESAVLRPLDCECGSPEFLFREYALSNGKYGITGHCDGLIKLPGREGFGVFEAKSIGAYQAHRLTDGPKPEHVLQVHVYMWLLDLRWSLILYWNKSGDGVSALTEFIVERDDRVVSEIQANLESLRVGLSGGDLPQRVCKASDCDRALSCCVRTFCFEGHVPKKDAYGDLF